MATNCNICCIAGGITNSLCGHHLLGLCMAGIKQSRILRQIKFPDGCWEWGGSVSTGGYGRTGNNQAHREVYEMFNGAIPEGLVLDHLCRNRSCVNPHHLEPVTQRENILRGLQGRMLTHCKKGHPFSLENTHWYKGQYRRCRRCNAEAQAERRRRAVGSI